MTPAVILQEVAIPAISRENCERMWSDKGYKIKDSHICFYDGRGSGCMVGYQLIYDGLGVMWEMINFNPSMDK